MVAYFTRMYLSTLVIIYGLICLIWAIVIRFVFTAYFSSAYAALLGVILSIFMWIECALPFQGYQLLTCYARTQRRRLVLQISSSIIFLLLFACPCIMGVLYNILFRKIDVDYMVTILVFAFGCCLLISKIHVIRLRNAAVESNAKSEIKVKTSNEDKKSMDSGVHDSQDPIVNYYRHQRKIEKRRHIIYSLIISAFFVIYVVLLIGISLRFGLVLYLSHQYRPNDNIEMIHIDGYSQLSMFVRCVGNGNTTVLLGSDWARVAELGLSFLPKLLTEFNAKNGSITYRVCMYDRFGYGWSGSLETDQFIFAQEHQSIVNVKAIKYLADSGIIKRPFIFIGVGLSTLQADCFAELYSKYLKAVIFIDWYTLVHTKRLGQNENEYLTFIRSWIDLISSGWLELHWILNLPSLEWFLMFPFHEISNTTSQTIRANFMIANVFKSIISEGNNWNYLGVDGFCEGNLIGISNTDHVVYRAQTVPTLLIDRNPKAVEIVDVLKHQFAARHLPNTVVIKTLTDWSSTDQLMYTNRGAKEVSGIVNDFVEGIS